MPKAHKSKRKIPITTTNAFPTSSSSKPRSSRTLIRHFHVLLKKKAQLSSTLATNAADYRALADLESEIEELGGLAAYQRMSSIGQGDDRGGGSEKVLIPWLRDLGHPTRQKRLKLLEVGALKHDNFHNCTSWLDVTPMDLRSRHPEIMEQDFLLLDLSTEGEHFEKWDVISLSLVVNFVPNAGDRGRMLSMAYQMLLPKGLIFLALPLPCISNSRYLTPEHLKSMMSTIGFTEIRKKWKEGGRMAYWLYQKEDLGARKNVTLDGFGFGKKVVFRTGNRNNFCILL